MFAPDLCCTVSTWLWLRRRESGISLWAAMPCVKLLGAEVAKASLPMLHGHISMQNTLFVCLFPRYLAPRLLIKSSLGWARILTRLLAGSRHSVLTCRMCACVSVCVSVHVSSRMWTAVVSQGAGVYSCCLAACWELQGPHFYRGTHFCGCVVYHCHGGNIKRAFYEREHQRKHYS